MAEYVNYNAKSTSLVVAPTSAEESYYFEVPARVFEERTEASISEEDLAKLNESMRIHEKSLKLLGQ